MTISAAPIIYILIFVAVLMLVEGIYLTVFGKSISLNSRVSRRLDPDGKRRKPRTGAGATPQGDEPAHDGQGHPALFDPGRQGAEGEHRLFAPRPHRDHGPAQRVQLSRADGRDRGRDADPRGDRDRHGRGRRLHLGEQEGQEAACRDRGTTRGCRRTDGALACASATRFPRPSASWQRKSPIRLAPSSA